MSEKETKAGFIDHVRNWIFDLPESELLEAILELRFTPEEMDFLSMFPHMPHTMEQLSERYGIPADELAATIEPLIRKGLIYQAEGRTAVRYSFPDSIFLLYRTSGWKGEDDEWSRKFSALTNRYYIDSMGADFRGHPTKGLRVIPIAHTVEETKTIMPYEDVMAFLEKEEFHSVSTCVCRHRHNLDPDRESCKHETENCLHFGRLGRYIVQNDMGREISREETREILEAAAAAGLVHSISNTREGMDTICNCCACCCLFLEPVKSLPPGNRDHQRSNYMLDVERDTCKACGLCAERCPVDALELRDKEGVSRIDEDGKKRKARDVREIVYDPETCIGCGVCVFKCPTSSLKLIRREVEEYVPENMSEIGSLFLAERGRDLKKIF